MRPSPECRLCALSAARSHLVLPDGDPDSPVVLVGEAPGEREDREGRPFVGRSGGILDNMLEEVGLPRESLLITNTVKCRPPENRDPRPEEMAACRPFLAHELSGRRLVIGLGRSACLALTGETVRMKDVANRMSSITLNGESIPFLPTYHPAATIYSREAREALREALQMVRDQHF